MVATVSMAVRAGNPFSGEATIGWADPILAGSAAARAKGPAGEPARPVPLAVKPLRIKPSARNAMLEDWPGASSRGLPATSRAQGAKCDDKKWRVWLAYPRKPYDEKPLKIFEAHSWSGESLTFDASKVRSVSTSVIIEGGLGLAGITTAGTAALGNATTVETGAGTKPIDRRYRGFIEGQFDVARVDYLLVDQRKFENWQHTKFHRKGDPTMPHGEELQKMQCQGKPSRVGHAVVGASSGVGYTNNGAAGKGRDGYTVRDRGGRRRSSDEWDMAPAKQKYLKVARRKAYTVTSGFKIGTAVGNVSLTQERRDESGSVATWEFRDNREHFFGGAGKSIKEWPVIYAGQK